MQKGHTLANDRSYRLGLHTHLIIARVHRIFSIRSTAKVRPIARQHLAPTHDPPQTLEADEQEPLWPIERQLAPPLWRICLKLQVSAYKSPHFDVGNSRAVSWGLLIGRLLKWIAIDLDDHLSNVESTRLGDSTWP